MNQDSNNPVGTSLSQFEKPATRWHAWLIIAAVGLTLRVALLLAMYRYQPAQLHDYHLSLNPDAIDYVTLGRNIWFAGRYSREPDPPYRLDAFRTPVYPFLIGALQGSTDATWPIYIFQIVLSLMTAMLVREIALPFGPRIALWAGLFYSADLALAISDMLILTETMFTTFSTLAIWLWQRSMPPEAKWQWPAAAGGIIGIAALVRPTGLYLVPVFAVAHVLLRRPLREAVRKSLILAGCSIVVVAPWMIRNYVCFNLFSLSTVQNINMVYSLGAGAYQQEFGVSRGEAGAMIQREFDLPSFTILHHAWLSDKSVAELDRELREAYPSILAKYPRSLAIACGKGMAKSLVAHDMGNLAYLVGENWIPPSFSNLRKGDFRAFAGRLLDNSPGMIAAFVYQTAWNVLVLVVGGVGVVRCVRDPARRSMSLCFLFVIAYWLATICVMGPDATARYRFPLLPLWYVFTASGLHGNNARSLVREIPTGE